MRSAPFAAWDLKGNAILALLVSLGLVAGALWQLLVPASHEVGSAK